VNYSIGCNIVDPVCDVGTNYTKDVYLKNIAKYREYGVSHLEFSHVTVLSEDDAKEIKDFCQKIGITPWSVHSEHLNAPGKEALDEYLCVQDKCARTAAALGTKVCVCHIPNVEPRAGEPERDIDVLKRVADITGKYGLKLAIETPPYDYIIELVDAISREDVGMNLDTGHSFLEGNDPAKVAKAIGKRLFTTHLQDNFGENDDHQAPGIGKINWRETLKAIKESGYDGPLMLELTGGGVKARRTVPQLRDFELDKEMVFALSYINLILNEIK
jgi:sugar phosphate isomerase/epimerase